MAVNIMIQGTMSNAGKSLIVTGLCRVFSQDGYRVAPFKSQNMALNSFVTEDGLEIGRAQAVQAEACGKAPSVFMNPVLLKPTTDVGSQVIVNGKVRGNMSAIDYFKFKRDLIPEIMAAYKKLDLENDIIVIEGAGSPAEINLKSEDIVNMGLAEMVDAPVLLVGDIDRGGVFAQLAGTVMLLEEHEKERIKGLIINKFRGDKAILEPGLRMIEEICGKPVVGVVPYADVDIDDEDSLTDRFKRGKAGVDRIGFGGSNVDGACMYKVCHRTENSDEVDDNEIDNRVNSDTEKKSDLKKKYLEDSANKRKFFDVGKNSNNVVRKAEKNSALEKSSVENDIYTGKPVGTIEIKVIRLPKISNFSDFSALEAVHGVSMSYTVSVQELQEADVIIIPGTKNTIADMEWMRRQGVANAVVRASKAGTIVIGICGGYQALGGKIIDKSGVEGENSEIAGLGLLPVITEFEPEKLTTQVSGRICSLDGIFKELSGIDISGYEIHMGRTVGMNWCEGERAACGEEQRNTSDINSISDICGSSFNFSMLFREEKVKGREIKKENIKFRNIENDCIENVRNNCTEDDYTCGEGDKFNFIKNDYIKKSFIKNISDKHNPVKDISNDGEFDSFEKIELDGCVCGNVIGTYLHGIFDNNEFTEKLLAIVARRKGLDPLRFSVPDMKKYREEQYDKLADIIRESLDMKRIYKMMGLK